MFSDLALFIPLEKDPVCLENSEGSLTPADSTTGSKGSNECNNERLVQASER